MGRILLVGRVVLRDLRHRPVEAILLLLAITAAATTLTLGLGLNGVMDQPYQRTRAATAGPDVVAQTYTPGQVAAPATAAQLAQLTALAKKPGVTGSSGPYPVTMPTLKANGYTVNAVAEGRDAAPAAIDRPEVTQGTWVRADGAVLERSFAAVLGVGVGDSISLNGRSFRVVGLAVTAAMNPYPVETVVENYNGTGPGMLWLTEPDARSLASTANPISYILNLKLANPATAETFGDANQNQTVGLSLISWTDIAGMDELVLNKEQNLLDIGGSLLGLFAVTSVALLVGGRMADQRRRVGLLKAVGGTPGLVAVVLLAENMLLSLVAAAAGLALGWAAAPLVSSPGAGLLGAPGAPSLTLGSAELVIAVALAVAVAASLVPALRAARVSTVRALADGNRAPRRRALTIRLSARLPVPLLLGLRLSARRPRRSLLSAFSITLTVAVVVAVLTAFSSAHSALGPSLAPASPKNLRPEHVVLGFTAVLIALAVVNVVFITWATALDSRRPLAIARALGATVRQVAAGLSAAQVLPSLAGAVLGVPAGLGLFAMLSHGKPMAVPPAWQLLATVLGSLLLLGALTAVPARLGARRPVAEILQSELV